MTVVFILYRDVVQTEGKPHRNYVVQLVAGFHYPVVAGFHYQKNSSIEFTSNITNVFVDAISNVDVVKQA